MQPTSALDIVEYFGYAPEEEATRMLELAHGLVEMREEDQLRSDKTAAAPPERERPREENTAPSTGTAAVAIKKNGPRRAPTDKTPATQTRDEQAMRTASKSHATAEPAPAAAVAGKTNASRRAPTGKTPATQARVAQAVQTTPKSDATVEPAPARVTPQRPEPMPRYRTAAMQEKARLERIRREADDAPARPPKPARPTTRTTPQATAEPAKPPKKRARPSKRWRPARPIPPRPGRPTAPDPVYEYESVVDFSARGATRGQIHPVQVDGQTVRPQPPPPRQANKTHAFYDGDDGATLAKQPHHHREQWTDRQWAAFEEHKASEKHAEDDTPHAVAVRIING